MAEEGVTRKLAAILYADVTGYSRLAAATPDARLVELNCSNHALVSNEPAFRQLLGEIHGFLREHPAKSSLLQANPQLYLIPSVIQPAIGDHFVDQRGRLGRATVDGVFRKSLRS